ncbi:MAG: HigA family addiction module antitoxin [Patescibacteria group bacterium]|nr:HigA family addiction module antitoxin [Patescibacteria group bacterium]
MTTKNQKSYIENKKKQGLYGVDFLTAEHPGATLQDELDFFGLTQKALAEKIGYTAQTVNRIIKGVEPITTDIALALERVFDGSPSVQFWLNMQSEYDQEISKVKELEETEEVQFFKDNVKATFKELQKGHIFENYLLNTRINCKKAIIDIKNFFGSYSLRSIPDEAFLGVAFRKGGKKDISEYNLAAILKIGDRKAKAILKDGGISRYNKINFLKLLPKLKKISNETQKDFLRLLQEECLKVGVIVVYVPNMTNTVFGGATMRIANHPVILLKVENQREDIFWFNFYHEAGHIVKHSKKKVFIDFDEDGQKNEFEIDANEFASSILYSDFDEIKNKIEKNAPLDIRIKKISQIVGISKSIVAGKICNLVGCSEAWKILSKYRPTIKEKIGFIK